MRDFHDSLSAREGSHEWYQSIGLAFVDSFADCLHFLGPWFFKLKKKFCATGVKNSLGGSAGGASAVKQRCVTTKYFLNSG